MTSGAPLGSPRRAITPARRLRRVLRNTYRRRGWFLEHLTLAKLTNLVRAAAAFALKRERLAAWPAVVKIDISPLCNLQCTFCVHADADGSEKLAKQHFHARQRMSVEDFRRIIDEIEGHATSVSLYYLGDPLAHPDHDEMAGIARGAGLNVHSSTNFSFPLSDERIERLVSSGVTHLTVCVDGLSQEKYALTRVGGHIDRVLSNLERLCACRERLGRRYPRVEVQYIKYQHNLHELEEAKRIFAELGVDQVSQLWGALHNCADWDPEDASSVVPKPTRALPQCHWPHFATLIKYNGDVIPCCISRMGQQYSENDDPRVLGNVFETSLREVWDSEKYQQARRLASNPGAVVSDPSLESSFCHGCQRIYDVDPQPAYVRSDQHAFEELWEVGPKGRPVRRSSPT